MRPPSIRATDMLGTWLCARIAWMRSAGGGAAEAGVAAANTLATHAARAAVFNTVMLPQSCELHT
jgi:hypothetical protein